MLGATVLDHLLSKPTAWELIKNAVFWVPPPRVFRISISGSATWELALVTGFPSKPWARSEDAGCAHPTGALGL